MRGSNRHLNTSGLVLFAVALTLPLAACDLDMPPGPGPRPGPGAGGGPGGNVEDLPAAELVDELREVLDDEDIFPLPAPPPVSAELYALGEALAFDKVLSGNQDIACLTCHHPALGTDDDRHLPSGVNGFGLGEAREDGDVIPRNAPPLFNMHTYDNMFWDGRVELVNGQVRTPAGDQLTPEMLAVFDFGVVSAQAMFPVTSREEMRGLPGENELANLADDDFTGIWAALMARLGDFPNYVQMFEAAYPGEDFDDMSFAHAANAIAAFEIAAFDSRDSPWERFVAGDDGALSNAQLVGALEFYDNDCQDCHSGAAMSDFEFHNIGLAQFGPGVGHGPAGDDDFGREGVTGNPNERYEFRTPPLFNVVLTAPYGHAGQFSDLDDHIEQYRNPRAERERYDIREHVSDASLWGTLVNNAQAVLAELSPDADLNLNNQEVDAIVDFLGALTDDDVDSLEAVVPSSVPSGLPVAD